MKPDGDKQGSPQRKKRKSAPRKVGGAQKGKSRSITKGKDPAPETAKGNPGQTAAHELDKRIAVTAALLQKGWRKYKIKLRLKELFGVSARTCETYLSRAREELRADTGKPRSEHVEDLYGLLWGIIEDAEATNADKIRATREIRHLLLLSGDRVSRGPVLNQQINVHAGLPSEQAGNEEDQVDVPIGELDLESRGTRIGALAERLRTRGVIGTAGESRAS